VNGIVVFVIKPFVLDIIRIIKQSDVEVTSPENHAESQIIAKISCAIRTDVLKIMSIMSMPQCSTFVAQRKSCLNDLVSVSVDILMYTL